MKMLWSVAFFNGILEENLSAYINEIIYTKNVKHLPGHLQQPGQLRYEHREISMHSLLIFPSIFL